MNEGNTVPVTELELNKVSHNSKMPLILCPCKTLYFTKYTLSLNHAIDFANTLKKPMKFTSPTRQKFYPFTNKFAILGATHVPFCSKNVEFDGFYVNKLSQETVADVVDDDDKIQEQEQEQEKLELLDKPSLVPIKNGPFSDMQTEKEEEALAPFLKFFKGGDDSVVEVKDDENEESKKVGDGYYEPKPGDFVVGVVVSGNENKMNVNVGAELLGTMLTKEVLPLYGKEMEHLLCGGEGFMAQWRIGILKNDDAMNGMAVPGRTVVEIGTVLFAEVLGRTLAGRPLLSSRRFFRRIAWHRLRQIKQLNEPIEVRITEWNTKGLLTRIEGLRAFLPKAELVKRVNSFTELKENIGRRMYVQITQADEAKSNLIISEKEAWEKLYLREGTLLEGTVKRILPYGAQIRIGETNRSQQIQSLRYGGNGKLSCLTLGMSHADFVNKWPNQFSDLGLLHVSNITRAEITSVSDILSVDEKVKVLVGKSLSPEKISLSIADLESEPGLFLSNKERVFLEADMMAKKYRKKLPPPLITQQPQSFPNNALPFENEALYANWKWFKFEKK